MQKRQVLPTIPKQYEQLGWEGGFNSNDDSTKILQNQITGESKNVTIENKLLKKVTGYTQEGVIFPAGGTAINGLDKYYSESGSRYLMTVSGVQTYYDIGAGHVVTGGVLSGEYRITSVTMNNLWILCNGNDVARKFEHGVGTGNLGGVPPVAYLVDKFEDRCVMARSDALPKRFWFSSLSDPEAWNTGVDYFNVDEDITAICPTINWFVIFAKNSFYAWNGEVAGDTAQIVPHKQGIGCVGSDACATTNYGIVFVDEDNVYLTDGMEALPIGENIKDIISGIALKSNIVVKYKDNLVYIFYTPSGGATNSEMLVGELNVKTSNVSIRWWPPIEYPGNVATFFSYSFNVDEELYFGRPDVVEIYKGFDGHDFDGADIDGIADFKLSDVDNAQFKKREKKVFIAAAAAYVPIAYNLQVGIVFDGDDSFTYEDVVLDPSTWYFDSGLFFDAGLVFDAGSLILGKYIRTRGKYRWTQIRIRNENKDEPFTIYNLGRVYRPIPRFK